MERARITTAAKQVDEWKYELAVAVHEAHTTNGSVKEIASAAGCSHRQVYILSQRAQESS